MFRRTPSRLTLLLAVSVLAGCECGSGEPTCSEATVSFVTPDDGATVPGTFEVAIAAEVDGAPFTFDAATLSVQGRTFTGTLSGNAASFTDVTATPGTVELKASIARGSCSKTVTRTVTVREETCTAPTVLGLSFPQDTAAPLGVLNSAELPTGTPLQVRVEAGCVNGAQVRIKRGVTVVGALTAFTNGVATVTLPTLPDADSAQYDLFAELVRDGVALNQPVGAALGSIRVQRGNPSACVLVSVPVYGPVDDAQPAVAGFQVRVTGAMDPSSTGVLRIDTINDAVPVTPNAQGDVSADFTLQAASDFYVARLTCTDSAGNSVEATSSFATDFDPPVVTITAPAANSVVTASPLTMDVTIPGGELGGSLQVLVNGQSVDALTLDGAGVAHPTVSFAADGSYQLQVRVTDVAGNVGEATVTVTVQLSGCGLVFTRPATSPALLTPAQLQAGTYSFQTTSKPECAGQAATLFRAEVLEDGGTTAEAQVGSATLSATGVAAFSPLAMSSGAYRFRGAVVNPGDAGVSAATVQVTVDLDGPAITSPVVPVGQTAASLSSFQDSQPNTPGVQRTLEFSALVPIGARVDVCTTQAIDPVSGMQRPTSAECGSGFFLLQQGVVSPVPGFTFPEGSYSLKVVVVGTGVTPAPESAAVAIISDGTRPCVQANTIDLPQDVNGDGRLNAAELNGAQPVLVFTPGCGDTPATLSATAPVVVRDLTNGAPAATRPSTAVFAGGQYTVTLTGAYTSEVDLDLFVQLTDLVANQNRYVGAGDPAVVAFRVDPVAPGCAIASPSAAVLGIAQVPGGALDVTVNTATDVASGGVRVTFTGQAARDLTPSSGTVTTQYTGLTGDNQVTIGATCTDAAGNVATATPVTTRIDLSAPTCAITAPTSGTTVTANEVQTTVALTGVADGEVLFITSSLSGIANNQLTVTGGAASRLVRYPKGAQTVTASIADAAGNECVAPPGGSKSITLTVNNASCSLDFAAAGPISTNGNGSWLNRAGAGLPESGATPGTASVAVGAVTSDCGAGRNVYLYAGPASATPSGAPQVTNASGAVTFPPQAFTEGAEYTVTIDDGTGLLTHRSFVVSLAAPTVGGIALQRSAGNATLVPVAKNAALTFGAFSGNHRVDTALVSDMVFGDLNATLDGAELALALTNIDGARVAPFDATLEVLGVTAPVTQAIDTDGASPSFALKLPHQVGTSTVNMVIRVTSPAGNTYTSTHVSQVDVVAPAALSVTQTLGSARAATVNLAWAPVNDDGSDAASGAANYDVRWTTLSVPGNDSMAQPEDFFSDAVKQEGITSAPSRALTLPPLNTYFIAARAVDEVGNYSAFVAPTALANMWPDISLSIPNASSNFGQSIVTGAIVNGGTAVAVAAPSQADGGSVYLYQMGLISASQTSCSAGCQQLTPSDSTPGAFGSDLSASGNLGDVGAESLSDLVVGQTWSAAGNGGRVVIYFGSPGVALATTDAIELRGDTTTRIGQSAQIIADLDGDGLDELAVAAPLWNANQGRVFIYKGRSRAQWAALRTATDGATGVPYVPVPAGADVIIEGPTPLMVSPAGNAFGQNRRGLVSTLDFDGDGRRDLGVPMSRGTINRYRVFPSGVLAAVPPGGSVDGGYRLEISEPVIGDNANTAGVGTAVLAGDFIDSTQPDLLVSYPGVGGGGQLLLFSGVTAPTNPTINPTVSARITGPLTFGQWVSVGRIDDDATSDFLAATNLTTGNSAWLVYQHLGIENCVLGSNACFWASKFDGPALTGNANSRLGGVNQLADVDDDGKADVILGDFPAGLVRIWRAP